MTNSLKRAYGTDSSKEETGTWFDIDDTIRIKIRRFRSRAAQDAAKEFTRAVVGAKKRTLTDEQQEEITTKVMAKAIIADWEGVEDDNGPMECNFENKYAILADPEMKDFRDMIAENAVSRELFAKELDDDAMGN